MVAGGGAIAFGTGRDGNAEVYVMRSDGSSPENLTSDPGADTKRPWSTRPVDSIGI